MSEEERRFLIVDDEEVVRMILRDLFEGEGFQISLAPSGVEAMEKLEQEKFDLVLVDKNLPDISGLEILRLAKERNADTEVIVITGYASLESALESIRLGAFDYILKPFESLEGVKRRIRIALEKKEAVEENRRLLRELRKSHWKISKAYEQTLEVLANVIGGKDFGTREHIERVRNLAVKVGRRLGLEGEELKILRFGAILHDIGKIGVESGLLSKESSLTKEEYHSVQKHVTIGVEIIQGIDFLEPVIPLIKYHHERYNGSGYPEGLEGERIPLGARIIAAVDAFDAMVSQRPYRSEMGTKEAWRVLEQESGKSFDPRVISALGLVIKEKEAWDGIQEEGGNEEGIPGKSAGRPRK